MKLRSKSPILESNTHDEKKLLMKRPRKVETTELPINYIDTTQRPRTFIPIHAAFECKASYHVIERVLMDYPNGVEVIDDSTGQNVLHYAMTHCHNDTNIVDLILDPSNHIITAQNVRAVDRTTGQLPLHIAIENRANVRIIKVLLQEYPSSGVGPCRTYNEFYNKTPIHMATHYNCDISTVFELLRVDPSFVLKHHW
jgi:beta-galactosidase GanA